MRFKLMFFLFALLIMSTLGGCKTFHSFVAPKEVIAECGRVPIYAGDTCDLNEIPDGAEFTAQKAMCIKSIIETRAAYTLELKSYMGCVKKLYEKKNQELQDEAVIQAADELEKAEFEPFQTEHNSDIRIGMLKEYEDTVTKPPSDKIEQVSAKDIAHSLYIITPLKDLVAGQTDEFAIICDVNLIEN